MNKLCPRIAGECANHAYGSMRPSRSSHPNITISSSRVTPRPRGLDAKVRIVALQLKRALCSASVRKVAQVRTVRFGGTCWHMQSTETLEYIRVDS
jgi:hypothetical protein